MNIPAIDRTIGTGNGRFIGLVANGTPREDLVKRWKAGEFPELNPLIGQYAMSHAGMGVTEGKRA